MDVKVQSAESPVDSNNQEEHTSSLDSDHGYSSVVLFENGNSRYDDPSGILPGIDDYAGPLNFQLFLNTEDNSRKSWLYSTVLKKLYIDINKVVCVRFKYKQSSNSQNINSSEDHLVVRALPVYSPPEHLQEPVTRCPVHILKDKSDGYEDAAWLNHVLRAEHHEAIYHVNRTSKRHSVIVPLRTPTLGSEFITVMYKFTCKTSCVYGLSRRPVHVIFTLETTSGEILGRRKLLVKVCSCPKRDLHRDEMLSKCDANDNVKKKRKEVVDHHDPFEEVSSPSPKEFKFEHSEEDNDSDNMTYTLPLLHVIGRRQYISTLELLHGHFLGLSVRNDSLLDMHPNISRIAELLDKLKNESRDRVKKRYAKI